MAEPLKEAFEGGVQVFRPIRHEAPKNEERAHSEAFSANTIYKEHKERDGQRSNEDVKWEKKEKMNS